MPDAIDALVAALEGADFDALVELAACGNRQVALRCWERSRIRAADRFGGRARLERTPMDATGVFFPVVHGDLVLVCAVELAESAPPPRLDPVAREAARRAVLAAWRDAGGRGPPPAVHPVIRPRSVHVEGASLHAAVYLAGLAHFGAQPFTDRVIVTGDPEHAPDGLDAKAALAADLGLDLLVVSPRPAAGLRAFRARDELAGFVFTVVPWIPDAQVVRVHVHSGKSKGRPPAGAEAEIIELPDPMGPQDAVGAAEQLGRLLHKAGRIELSVAGPMPLVAALGHAARNHQTPVRLVAADSSGRKMAVWHNRVQRRVTFGSQADESHIVVGDSRRQLPPGWRLVDVGSPVTPSDLGRCVDQVLVQHGATQVLHVAFATWLPLVWATSAQLRNQGLRVYYHFQRGRYVPWLRCEGDAMEAVPDSA